MTIKEGELKMIENYTPNYRNEHLVRVTFNYKGYIGHITASVGGNCKGTSILKYALNIFDEYDQDDIESLAENDCEFFYDEDNDDFSITLYNPQNKTDTNTYKNVFQKDIENMVVGVEIVSCSEENEDGEEDV